MRQRAANGLGRDGGAAGRRGDGGTKDDGGVCARSDGEWTCVVGGYACGEIRQGDLNGTRKAAFGIDGDGDRLTDAASRNGDGG